MRPALLAGSILLLATSALADETKSASVTPSGTASAPKPVPQELSVVTPPAQPASFSVEMHMVSSEGEMVMKRTVDGPKTRMDISGPKGMNQTIIMLGDDKQTMITVDPNQKRAMKMSQAGMAEHMGKTPASPKPDQSAATQAQGEIKLLGQETIDGHQADKYEIDYGDKGKGTMWVDSANNLPLRMEAQDAKIEFKNYQFGPQPADAFEVPKDYKLTDVDAEMAKMPKNMMAGMAQGMAGGMMGGMGGGLGGSLGGSLGGMLGGPIGSMVGQYVGQKIGQKIGTTVGEKAAGAVTGH